MGGKINFMALSCQNTGLFQSFMAYYAKTDYFLCVYELVNKVGIYFIEVSKRIICVRLWIGGWMDELGFYVPSSVFQSFRDDERMNMKGSMQ